MIGLFVGIESFDWTIQDFDNLIKFCVANDIQQIVLKVWEITQGEWYKDTLPGGAFAIVQYLRAHTLDVLPYGFYYGNDSNTEIVSILHYLELFGTYCIDVESDFDGNAKIEPYVSALANHSGTLSVSTWANPVTHNWIRNIELLNPIVQSWMPQVYDANLLKDMYGQFPKVQGRIEPTFHIIGSDYHASSIYSNFTLWEYRLAQQNSQTLQNYVRQNKGEQVSVYPTNSRGMVAEFLPVPEFQPGHSEFECGAFAVALNMRATNANTPNHYDTDNLIAWAENEYAKTAGSNLPNNSAGVSINDMHIMIKDTQEDANASSHLHWWDIISIGVGSPQSHDIAEIKAALNHGYTVIATVSEQSVFDLDLGRNPYWWGPTGNHILTYVGISSDGSLLAADPANVIRGDGNLQTPKQVQSWPRRYDITKLDNQWATIVQHSWLPPIPSGDPLSWPAYSPPQPLPPPPPKNEVVSIMYDPVGKTIMFIVNNQTIYRINL